MHNPNPALVLPGRSRSNSVGPVQAERLLERSPWSKGIWHWLKSWFGVHCPSWGKKHTPHNVLALRLPPWAHVLGSMCPLTQRDLLMSKHAKNHRVGRAHVIQPDRKQLSCKLQELGSLQDNWQLLSCCARNVSWVPDGASFVWLWCPVYIR